MIRESIPIVVSLAALAAAATARPREYPLPADEVPAALAGPQGEIIVANCMGCHSLDYISTQPKGKGQQFWRDAVNKMIHVYGAPVDPGEIEKLAAALDQSMSTP